MTHNSALLSAVAKTGWRHPVFSALLVDRSVGACRPFYKLVQGLVGFVCITRSLSPKLSRLGGARYVFVVQKLGSEFGCAKHPRPIWLRQCPSQTLRLVRMNLMADLYRRVEIRTKRPVRSVCEVVTCFKRSECVSPHTTRKRLRAFPLHLATEPWMKGPIAAPFKTSSWAIAPT